MKAVELMDSRKFMAVLGDLRDEMVEQGMESEGIAAKLQAVLDMANGQIGTIKGVPIVVKPVGHIRIDSGGIGEVMHMLKAERETKALEKPKRKRRTKAEMEADAKNPKPEMSKAETSKFAAEAERARLATQPAEVLIADFVKNHLKPAYDKGARTFNIPNNYKGRVMSTSEERWKLVLSQEGIAFTELDWSYPTVPVEQSIAGAGIPDDYIPLALK